MGSPVIGISTEYSAQPRPTHSLYDSYVQAVRRAGALCVFLPAPADEPEAAQLLSRVDGLLLIGGDDLDPAVYGAPPHPALCLMDPVRQRGDLALARVALAQRRPCLAICAGAQTLAVAGGGRLWRHLPDDLPQAGPHRAAENGKLLRHELRIEAATRLAALSPARRTEVNSRHHQAVAQVGAGWRIAARAADGVVEAVEGPDGAFALGIQWHPERDGDDELSLGIFAEFARQAAAEGR